MPRLTTIEYLKHRAALREEWIDRDAHAFVVLSPAEQFVIHDFFEPAKELSPLQLIAHRKDISTRRPALPQQPGWAFARIAPFLDLPSEFRTTQPVTRPSRTWSAKDRGVHVQSLVNPDLNPDAIAKILLELARQGPPLEVRQRAGGS